MKRLAADASSNAGSVSFTSKSTGSSSNNTSGASSSSQSNAEYLKWMALLVLVLQNSGLILFMRMSRVSTDSESVYCISTAVAISEVIKLCLSCVLLLVIDCQGSLRDFFSTLRHEFINNWKEFLKMCVPSGLYVIQNNLQYIGASNLPAAVFQVLVQMKIITTALFSVTMLSRQLSIMQWLSIVTLGCGIGLVQLSQQRNSNLSQSFGENSVVGVTAVLISCLTSGFAGVYFEKVLKTNATSIWTRNIQLALIGIVISLTTVIMYDLDIVQRDGFFRGYNSVVWTAVMLQAGGGLVVAVVVKYADNVMKGFATSISVVLSCVIASVIFKAESDFNMFFLSGASMVCMSALIFSSFPFKNNSSKSNNSSSASAMSNGASGFAHSPSFASTSSALSKITPPPSPLK